jgi:hypothetical protein
MALLALSLCWAVTSCNKPISRIAELEGCYFAGSSQTPAFEIRGAELRSPQTRSTLSISASHSDSTVLNFSPGIRVTDDERKSTVIVAGDEIAGLAFERGSNRYILLAGGGFPAKFEQRDCSNQDS